MANVTFDVLWREAMIEVLDELESETPEDPSLAPKDLAEWSCVYIKYLQIFRKLETAYDQVVHPQKRRDMKKALQACMGRVLEVKHWLIKLNRGLDFVNLDDILVDLKLTPDVLEVPCPRYFIEDRSKELEDRARFLKKLIEKYAVPGMAVHGPLPELPPLSEEEAIQVIQNNERGRQARERSSMMSTLKRQRMLEDDRVKTGKELTTEKAAAQIQASIRGVLARKNVLHEAEQELIFIGMRPKVQERRTWARRKGIQAEHQREYDEALVTLKSKVTELEGQDMRETITDKINAWFVENRDPESGEYPDFPGAEDGGSKIILNPPPAPPPAPPADEGAKKGGKEKPDAGKGKKKEEEKEPVEAVQEVSSAFVPDLEEAVASYASKWAERDEASNFSQRHDPELVKDEVRPLVFEDLRAEVDEEMKILLLNLKDMVEAERAAKTGKKVKKKKAKKAKKGKKEKGKKKKDPTADRSMESIYAELVSSGIVQAVPPIKIADHLGAFNFLGATLEKAGILAQPSMAQVRQAVTEFCLLPLGSTYVHSKAPHIKAVLLYGVPRTGKTSLAQAVAHLAGANFINLSPRNTDGKYGGKQVALMVHMAFKVARVMAPSVIYIDEIEKVFVSDKKKTKEFGGTEPFSRIKKEILKEMKALQPGERVILIGNSSEPFLCAKKDEKALMSFFDKQILLPLPDYASRKIIWQGLMERHGGKLDVNFDLSTLSYISEGYSSGTIDQAVQSLLTERRLVRMADQPINMEEVLQWLCKASPAGSEAEEAIQAWTDITPARLALLAEAKKVSETEDAKKDTKKKKK